eukprot:scaffold43926_cov71-Phaeocystis_antarctica.AAC.3
MRGKRCSRLFEGECSKGDLLHLWQSLHQPLGVSLVRLCKLSVRRLIRRLGGGAPRAVGLQLARVLVRHLERVHELAVEHGLVAVRARQVVPGHPLYEGARAAAQQVAPHRGPDERGEECLGEAVHHAR